MTERLSFLSHLAAGLAHRPDIKIGRGHWAWSPAEERMIIAPSRSHVVTDVDRGAVAHEAAHARISYYLLFRPITADAPSLSPVLLNCLEDCRIHEWLAQTYARSVSHWLGALRADVNHWRPRGASAVVDYLAACAVGEVVEYDAPENWDLSDIVQVAIAETRNARRSYARDYLPLSCEHMSRRELSVQIGRTVLPILESPHVGVPYTKATGILAAAKAWCVAKRQVVPTFLKLWRYDLARLTAFARRNPSLRRLLVDRSAAKSWERASAVAKALSSVEDCAAPQPDNELTPALEGYVRGAFAPSRGEPRAVPVGSGAPTRAGRSGKGDDDEAHDRLLDEAAGQVERVAEAIRKRLISTPPAVWELGQRCGVRPDMSGVVQAEANPRYDRIWQRRKVPDEVPEGCILLLVDLSGSMRGSKIAHAAAASLAIASALARIPRLSWEIFGFQDVLIPLVRKGPFSPESVRRHMLEEVNDTRQGGNNGSSWNDDGPCLLEAAARLPPGRSGLRRGVIVLSDGGPAGRRSTPADLTNAVRDVTSRGIAVVGLGIGPGTDHVTSYYPASKANVPLSRLGASIGEALANAFFR